jgi:hypothetical protein
MGLWGKPPDPSAGGLPPHAWFGPRVRVLTGPTGVDYAYRPIKHGGSGECDVFELAWASLAGHLVGRFWTDQDYARAAGDFPLVRLERDGQPFERLIAGPGDISDLRLRRAFIWAAADLRELDHRYRMAHPARAGMRSKNLVKPRTSERKAP